MPSSSSSRVKAPIGASSLAISPQSPGSDSPVDSGREDDGEMQKELVDGVRKLTVDLHPYRYHGKSSGLVFIRSALDLKTAMDGPRPPRKPRPGPESAVSSQAFPPMWTLSDWFLVEASHWAG